MMMMMMMPMLTFTYRVSIVFRRKRFSSSAQHQDLPWSTN
jgi:hypothetical protein